MHKIEALVELSFNLSSILDVLLRIATEFFLLLLRILEVRPARTSVLCAEASGDPYWGSKEGYELADLRLDGRDDLNRR